jgi:tRNA (guanosine-2'-O-)-methyltransferase
VSGGGPNYEPKEREVPAPDSLLLDDRKERIDQVVRLRTRNLVVVLDRLEDAFNMAAVLRTCEGMGLQEVHVIDNPDAPFRPNGKVTQGCDKWLDIRVHPVFDACREHLKSREFALWASGVRPGATSLFEMRFDSKMALIFGNERYGVSDEVLGAVDGVFWIPMRGFTQSFNVSAAASASITQAVGWRLAHLGPDGDLTEVERESLRTKFQRLSVKQRTRLYKDPPG